MDKPKKSSLGKTKIGVDVNADLEALENDVDKQFDITARLFATMIKNVEERDKNQQIRDERFILLGERLITEIRDLTRAVEAIDISE